VSPARSITTGAGSGVVALGVGVGVEVGVGDAVGDAVGDVGVVVGLAGPAGGVAVLGAADGARLGDPLGVSFGDVLGVPLELDAGAARPTRVAAASAPWSGLHAVVPATRATAPVSTRTRRRPAAAWKRAVAVCIVTPCLERVMPCDGARH
jgi:hypothetical protein